MSPDQYTRVLGVTVASWSFMICIGIGALMSWGVTILGFNTWGILATTVLIICILGFLAFMGEGGWVAMIDGDLGPLYDRLVNGEYWFSTLNINVYENTQDGHIYLEEQRTNWSRKAVIRDVEHFLKVLRKNFWLLQSEQFKDVMDQAPPMTISNVRCESILDRWLLYNAYRNHGHEALVCSHGENCTHMNCLTLEGFTRDDIAEYVFLQPLVQIIPHLPRELRQEYVDAVDNAFEMDIMSKKIQIEALKRAIDWLTNK